MSFHDIKESQRSNFKSPKILRLFHDRLVFVFILHNPISVPQIFFLSSSDAKKSLYTKWLMMKCFLPCFGAKSKRTKHFRSPIATPTATAAASNVSSHCYIFHTIYLPLLQSFILFNICYRPTSLKELLNMLFYSHSKIMLKNPLIALL